MERKDTDLKGWLIVNSFVKWDKFSEIYELLLNAGKKNGVDLEMKNSSDICLSLHAISISHKRMLPLITVRKQANTPRRSPDTVSAA